MTTAEQFQRNSFRQFKRIGIVPRMTRDERVQFVLNYVDNQIFTSLQVRNPNDLAMVFMPLILGALDGWEREDAAQIGCFYEYLSAAGPRAINGMPSFLSVKFMHRDDCERCFPAIERELERRNKAKEDIEV